MTYIAAVIGAFLIVAGIFIITLILHREVQTLHQTKEVGVTVGSHAVCTTGHKVIGISIRVATKFWQHIGPAFNVVQDAIVTAVIEGAVIAHLHTREGQTRPGLIVRTFGVVCLNVVFPLCEAGHHVVDLGFTFEAQSHIGLIAIFRRVVREIMQTIYFAIQIQFIAVFIINFSCVSGASH